MRRSSLDTIDVGIDRELSSQFDAVKLVADNLDDVERVSAAIADGSLEAASNIVGDIQAIGANIADITAVGTNIDGVVAVADDLANVDIVATNIGSVNAVGPVAADVSVVASEIAAVVVVADIDNMADIKRVANDLNAIDDNMRADITIVAGDLSLGVDSNVIVVSQNIDDVVVVANNIADVTAVGSNINSVVVSSDNIRDIVVVATDLTMAGWSSLLDAGSIIEDVESEPTGVSLIETVATNISEVVLVGENIDDVVTVAGNINAIETNAANIIDIQNAEENAASSLSSANIASAKASEASVSASTASTQAAVATTKANEANTSAAAADASADNSLASENKAEKWADEAEDVEVEAGKYSAKHWAMKAQGFAEVDATNMGYDNTSSGLVSTNVQAAIDEIVVNTEGIHDASNITTGTLDDARLPNTISSNITGNAATATKWSSSRTITLSGDVTGSVSIDGSADVTLTTTVAANSVALGTDTTGNYVAGVTQGTGISVTGTAEEGWSPTVSLTNVGIAGTYRSVTTDAQGRVISGTNPTTVADYGLTDVYTKTEVHTVLPKVGFDTTNVTTPSAGQMAWNIDENTVDLGLNGATLQIGQEQLVRVRNNTGSTIVNGTAVMATGTLGASGRITVAPANINGSSYKYMLGVVTESIAAGSDGFCTVFGKVRGIQTNGANHGETWVDGDVIYVKDSDGGALTKVVPTGTQVKLPIAIVIKAHGTNGTLFIRVTPIDENASYTKTESDGMFVPLSANFILDLGGL